jgi:ABC-2 type transport system permease protein
MKLNKILEVARWEMMEKVKTKAFIISIILTPLLLIGLSIGPTLLMKNEQKSETTKVLGIADTSGLYFSVMKKDIESETVNNQPLFLIVNMTKNYTSAEEIKQTADKEVLNKNLEGYLLIQNGGTDSVKLEYRSLKSGGFREVKKMESAFNQARIQIKLGDDADKELLAFINNNVNAAQIKLDESGAETKADFLVTFFSFIFIMLLMMMIIYSGQMLVRSLLEEKSNRLIEILVSSCTPDELLTGKVLGLTSLNLLQVFIWIIIGIGLAGAALVPVDAFKNIFPIFIFFILGYTFYTALFVGIGAIVSTEQEAQQVTSYISMILILPVVFAVSAIENPSSQLISILSYIPFTLPSIMILRINVAPVSTTLIIITIGIMLLSIFLTIFISSKIFRIGILSYGKAPSLKELKSWLKEK